MSDVSVDVFVRMELLVAGPAGQFRQIEVQPPHTGRPIPFTTGGPTVFVPYAATTGVIQDLTYNIPSSATFSGARDFAGICAGLRASITDGLDAVAGISTSGPGPNWAQVRIYELAFTINRTDGTETYRPLAVEVLPSVASTVGSGWFVITGSPPQWGDDDDATYVYLKNTTYGMALVELVGAVEPTPTTDETPTTRLYPRDDAYGLGSAPRLYPPPRSGRVVGGHQ